MESPSLMSQILFFHQAVFYWSRTILLKELLSNLACSVNFHPLSVHNRSHRQRKLSLHIWPLRPLHIRLVLWFPLICRYDRMGYCSMSIGRYRHLYQKAHLILHFRYVFRCPSGVHYKDTVIQMLHFLN